MPTQRIYLLPLSTQCERMVYMHCQHRISLLLRRISCSEALFCGVWLAGLLLGSLFAAQLDMQIVSLMRPFITQRVSIVIKLSCAALPFVIAAYAVKFSAFRTLFVIAFCKTFAFALSGWLICAIFGSAGWLIRILLLFSDICTVPMLCWFSMRHINGVADTWKKDVLICSVCCVVAVITDILVISPFLSKIL